MKKRILVALLLILTLAFSISACGKEAESKTFKIYLVTMDRMDSYWSQIKEGCDAAVAEIKAKDGDVIEFIWDAPADGKEDGPQIEIINNAVANNADVILLAAHSATAQNQAIQAALDAGVKIIYVDAPANLDVEGVLQTIKTDNKAAGKLAGEKMLAELNAKGVTSGDIGVVSPDNASDSVVNRDAGFREAFAGTDFNILETQYGKGEAALSQELANAFITNGVVGIFGTNEKSAVGVANAIKESGKDIVGVGFDTSETVFGAIEDGTMLGTIAQSPYQMGYKGINNAYAFLKDGTVPSEKLVDSGAIFISKENIEEYK